MHRLWTDYLAGRPALCPRRPDLTVPIGETLPDVPIIPAERSHDKPENTPWPSQAATNSHRAERRSAASGRSAAPRNGLRTFIFRAQRPRGVVRLSVWRFRHSGDNRGKQDPHDEVAGGRGSMSLWIGRRRTRATAPPFLGLLSLGAGLGDRAFAQDNSRGVSDMLG